MNTTTIFVHAKEDLELLLPHTRIKEEFSTYYGLLVQNLHCKTTKYYIEEEIVKRFLYHYCYYTVPVLGEGTLNVDHLCVLMIYTISAAVSSLKKRKNVIRSSILSTTPPRIIISFLSTKFEINRFDYIQAVVVIRFVKHPNVCTYYYEEVKISLLTKYVPRISYDYY